MRMLVRLVALAGTLRAAGGIDVTIDPRAAARGQVWGGIGAISGGGATSALLRPYPDRQRREILDLLFRPGFGAALPILKVEIGGDAQTTDGTEPSHRHTREETADFTRGYEWWLMKEARARNPEIQLWGLPWAFPGWIDPTGGNNPYNNVSGTAEYVVDWVRGARSVHGLEIAMVGCWNERPWNGDYLKELRRQLDAAGFGDTGIIAADGRIDTLATAMLNDSALMDAVQAFGMHYPGMSTPASAMRVVERTGKQVFASEDYGVYFDSTGGKAWARLVNQNAVRGFMSGTIAWNLVSSYYQPFQDAWYGPTVTTNPNGLPFRLCGLMHAAWPWSGHYVVTPQLYVSAHITQFARIGWRYLPVGNGSGLLEHAGSYVTLVSPDGRDLTIIVEKMSWEGSASAWAPLANYTTVAERLTLTLGWAFAGKRLAVWKSVLRAADAASTETMFIQQPAITASASGVVTVEVCVDCLLTITTRTAAGHKGSFERPPEPKPFPLPYSDTFDQLAVGQEADFFQDQAGVWEGVPAPNPAALSGDRNAEPHKGMAMRQMVPERPVCWAGDIAPVSIIGSANWTDIVVEATVLWEEHGMPWVAARVSGNSADPQPPGPHIDSELSGRWDFNAGRTVGSAAGHFTDADGLIFAVDSATQSYILSPCMSCLRDTQTVLARGRLPASVELHSWHTLRLEVDGKAATGWLDGHPLFLKINVSNSRSPSGYAAIGCGNFTAALFTNFSVAPATSCCSKVVING